VLLQLLGKGIFITAPASLRNVFGVAVLAYVTYTYIVGSTKGADASRQLAANRKK